MKGELFDVSEKFSTNSYPCKQAEQTKKKGEWEFVVILDEPVKHMLIIIRII